MSGKPDRPGHLSQPLHGALPIIANAATLLTDGVQTRSMVGHPALPLARGGHRRLAREDRLLRGRLGLIRGTNA